MPKILCFDIDDTIMDEKGQIINPKEVILLMRQHQAAGGIILFGTDKKFFNVEEIEKNINNEGKLFNQLREEGVNIHFGQEGYPIVINGDTSEAITTIFGFLDNVDNKEQLNGFDANSGTFMVQPVNSPIGQICWTVVNASNHKEGEQLRLNLNVNGNGIDIITDRNNLAKLADGKFFHTLIGSLAHGYFIENICQKDIQVLIKPTTANLKAISMDEIVLVDDKSSNLAQYEQLGGTTVYPNSEVVQRKVHAKVNREIKTYHTYNTNRGDGETSLQEIRQLIEKIDRVMKTKMENKALLPEWFEKREELDARVEQLKKDHSIEEEATTIKDSDIIAAFAKFVDQEVAVKAIEIADENNQSLSQSPYLDVLNILIMKDAELLNKAIERTNRPSIGPAFFKQRILHKDQGYNDLINNLFNHGNSKQWLAVAEMAEFGKGLYENSKNLSESFYLFRIAVLKASPDEREHMLDEFKGFLKRHKSEKDLFVNDCKLTIGFKTHLGTEVNGKKAHDMIAKGMNSNKEMYSNYIRSLEIEKDVWATHRYEDRIRRKKEDYQELFKEDYSSQENLGLGL